jgi:hypothetical protein
LGGIDDGNEVLVVVVVVVVDFFLPRLADLTMLVVEVLAVETGSSF